LWNYYFFYYHCKITEFHCVFVFLAYVRTKYPAVVDRLVKALMAEKLQEFRDPSQKIELEPACDDIDDHDDSA
jgi:hypothetical protein